MLSFLAFICEFYYWGYAQLLGIKMKPLTKQLLLSVESSVYEGNELEQVFLLLQLLGHVKKEGHFSLEKKRLGKLTTVDDVYFTCT